MDAAIGRHPTKKVARMIRDDGDPSYTDFECLATAEWNGQAVCAMRATPKTGRTHQIRLHLAHVGLPILGDVLYLPARLQPVREPTTASDGSPPSLPHPARQALHAAALTIDHPVTNEPLTIQAPLPTDMKEVASVLKLPVDMYVENV